MWWNSWTKHTVRRRLLLAVLGAGLASSQTAPVRHGEQLLRDHQYAAAIAAYRAEIAAGARDVGSRIGLIRAMLRDDQFRQAKDAALAAIREFPTNAPLLTLLGDASFRMADFDGALRYYSSAVAADPANARGYWGIGRCYDSEFRRNSAREQYVKAFALDPFDPDILHAYLLRAGLKRPERIALLARLLEHEDALDPTDARYAQIELAYLQKLGDRPRARLDSPIRAYSIPLEPVGRDGVLSDGVCLRVRLNGREPLRLQLDTGASGVTLLADAARRSGVEFVSDTVMYGVGDGGEREAHTAIAPRMTIGPLEWTNYPVRTMLGPLAADTDGVIGANVFLSFLIRLNAGRLTLDLQPLPPAPDTDWNRLDRTISQGEEEYLKLRHIGHSLLVPTTINDRGHAFFLLDSGASRNLLSEEFARTLGSLRLQPHTHVRGASGQVKDVYSVDRVTLQFGRFRQTNRDILAVDLHDTEKRQGIELSGMIGWPILSQVVTTLNYRDGLADFALSKR